MSVPSALPMVASVQGEPGHVIHALACQPWQTCSMYGCLLCSILSWPAPNSVPTLLPACL